MKDPCTFKRLYHIYISSVLLSTFKLSFIFILRFISSGVLLSFGVLWSEFLSSFSLFANIAHFIIDNVYGVFKNIFSYLALYPSVGDGVIDENHITQSETTLNISNKSEWLSIISLAVLGLTGIVILAMIGDYYSPDIVRSIPYTGNILNSIYGFINSIYEWYYGTPEIVPKPNPEDLPYQERIPRMKRQRSISITQIFPESVSRSLSGGSTVTQEIPTPPATRTPTPVLSDLPPSPTFDSDTWI
jgi:hypothetical protein